MAESSRTGIAFLLSQLGAKATERFAVAVSELDLTPPQAGVLRRLGATEQAQSQQSLAADLGTAPSRVVGHLDELEARGLVSRTPGADRRVNVVALTPAGRALLSRLGEVARFHETALTRSLNPTQRRELRAALQTMADDLGLVPGVHPGYVRNPQHKAERRRHE